ncbi:MAG: hypothetical protein IJ351_04540 [Oscillospiraceae bacterium]|nr:hypothetical protein [Oscillospiraceae bacterium]
MARNSARNVALGGVTAALAVVIMCLGGIIPVATYVCPMLCAVLLATVLPAIKARLAWAWYGAVALLSLLLAPDKEAAAVFVFLGYYPIIKPWLDRCRLSILWKLLLFNTAIFLMYGLLIYVLGIDSITAEFQELGVVLSGVTLILGNVVLFLMDFLLTRMAKRKKRR